jgi:2-methylcitrate dehydratase
VSLIFGRLAAADYEDGVAADPRIDRLRERMRVIENPAFSANYMNPDKRAIGNAIQVKFRDGTSSARVAIDYPIGHRRRRAEGIPVLIEKFRRNLATRFDAARAKQIEAACNDQAKLEALPVDEFMALWVVRE